MSQTCADEQEFIENNFISIKSVFLDMLCCWLLVPEKVLDILSLFVSSSQNNSIPSFARGVKVHENSGKIEKFFQLKPSNK